MSMPTPIAVLPTPSDIGRVIAQGILDQLRTTGRATVGFPAGRTATPVAAALTTPKPGAPVRVSSCRTAH